jgi:hypothetical protein
MLRRHLSLPSYFPCMQRFAAPSRFLSRPQLLTRV